MATSFPFETRIAIRSVGPATDPNLLSQKRGSGERYMRYFAVATIGLTVLAVAGCASQSGVVPNGKGGYLIAKQAATGFNGLGNLKAEALEEANQYCLSQSQERELFVTSAMETQPPYVMGNYPRAQIEFRCAAPNTVAEAAMLQCKEKRLRGELKTYKASIECSNPKVYAAWKEAGDPNLDLVSIMLAARLVGAENVDKGKITDAEYQLQLAELNSRLNNERQRRNYSNADMNMRQAQTQAAQAQSSAAFMQGLAALQSANRTPTYNVNVCRSVPGQVDTCSYPR